MSEVTEKEFKAFLKVQKSGMYNMYDPEAIRKTGLDKDTYITVMKNYSTLKEKYEKEED